MGKSTVKTIVFSALLALLANGATAQTFEEVLGAAQSAVGDIGKYQQALQNPDARMQYALVQQMLKHQDPAIQRIAKEHALFSTNPVMREAAIKAILDSGATLRIQLAGAGESYKHIGEWVIRTGGTFVDKRGQVLVKANEAKSDACWGTRNSCVFQQVGTSLQYTPGSYITSVLNLGNDGVLRGTLSYSTTENLQVQIDLKE